MKKFIIFACLHVIFYAKIQAQNHTIEQILNQIEQNNNELKTYKSFIKSKQLSNKANNNLPDLQMSAYYLPFGEHNTSDYFEYEITQLVEFPSVYSSREKLNNLRAQEFELAFAQKRQNILLQAKKKIIRLVFLRKLKAIHVKRQMQYQTVLEQNQKRFKEGRIDTLEYNKARLVRTQHEFKLEKVENKIININSEIISMNGGVNIDFTIYDFTFNENIEPLTSIWQSKLKNDPELKKVEAQQAITRQNIKLEKNKTLPDLTFGYNYQGIYNNNYSGFYGGISIPIWNNKNKVKAAQKNLEYIKSKIDLMKSSIYLAYNKSYKQYKMMLKKYREYQKILSSMDSQQKILDRFMNGNYSFTEYLGEMEFYNEAFEELHIMERDLQLQKAELTNHRL